ncbi:MAG: sulfatase-like hydrolase/transferase [Clostridia bacterium]|nr:sulfatase-like hydrolase/transferase [Clostridia bacterium]
MNKTKSPFQNINLNIKDTLVDKLWALLFCVSVFVYLELALHLFVYKSISFDIVFPLLFATIAGSVLFFISSLFPTKANRIIGLILIAITVIYYEVQLVYHGIFGTFMSVYQMLMGAEAVTNFFSQMMHAILVNILPILVLLIPLIAAAVLLFTKKMQFCRITLIQVLPTLLLTAVFSLITVLTLYLTNTSAVSAYAVLVNPNTTSESSIRTLGLVATTVQETSSLLAAQNGQSIAFAQTPLDDVQQTDDAVNAMDINFAELSDSTDSEALKAIDNYLSETAPSSKNEYTGIAEGYNVVTICAEAFSPLVISEDLTPTLYKLSNSGFVFNNFYNSFPNTTTNGEYTFCMGLLPNMSRKKIDSSFNLAADNYLPYCLGNALGEVGYETYAYHNYYATFYDRHITHPNMGYDFKAIAQGLDIPVENPCSDHEMMLESMDDFINSDKPFHAYYMTYSGHYQYDWNNSMSAKHRDKVEHLPYSDTVKAYIACNLEVEYALEALMKKLEEAGKADNTVIVLTTDHYPYGLPDEFYDELAGHTVDKVYEKYSNSFICYVPGITVEVDKYCSSADILPTVLNLLGVKYDSRLLAGRDVLSDSMSIAILADQSFITDDFRYDAATGTVLSNDGTAVDAALLQEYINFVANRFTLSTAILDYDYYAHVFDRTSQAPSNQVVNYEDIQNPYIESAVTFMVMKGYMEAVSDSEFGLATQEGNNAREFLQVLYKMAGSPEIEAAEGTHAALSWALSVGLTEDKAIWDTDVTYASAAKLIYRFTALHNGTDPQVNAENLAQRAAEYPDVPEDILSCLSWCTDNKIITGATLTMPYEASNTVLTRHQIATYLQRMYLMLN